MRPLARVLSAERPAQLAAWAIAAVAIICYANALQNGLAYDDQGIIPKHAIVTHTEPLWRAFAMPYWPSGAGQYRPLVIASYGIESWIWGEKPLGFHALNLLWHALASVLVFAVARRWLSYGGSLIAGLVFAVHPVHVEAVANVVGRAELMAACGVLAMMLLHERRSAWAVLAFAFALFSKEHAIVAPVLALGWDAALKLTRHAPDLAAPHEPPRSARTLFGGYALVAVAWAGAMFAVFRDAPLAAIEPVWLALDAPSRWLTMLGVVPTWARLWFVPAELSIDYSPRATLLWPENAPLAVAGALILAGAVAVGIAGRRKTPGITIALGWLALSMLPVANVVVPTGIIVAERTLYLSSVGAALLFGAMGERIGRWRGGAAIALTALVVSAFAVRTWTRTPVWETTMVLFRNAIAEHPEASRTHVLIARVYARMGDHVNSLDEYKRSLVLYDGVTIAWAEAINAAERYGDVAVGDSLVREARRRYPRDYLIDVAHANYAIMNHRFEEGLRAAQSALSAQPDSATARFLVGAAWAGLGRPDSALAWLRRVDPRHALGPRADSMIGHFSGRR